MPCSLLFVLSTRHGNQPLLAANPLAIPRHKKCRLGGLVKSRVAKSHPTIPTSPCPPIPEARTMSNDKTLIFDNIKTYQTSCRGLTSPNHTLRASLRKSGLDRFEPSCSSRGEIWVRLTESFFLYSLICYRFCIHVKVLFRLARIPSWQTWESSSVACLFN